MKNKMEELAKLLGVELEEEFDIETDKLINRCKVTKDGICLLHYISNKYILSNVDVCKLLTGEYKIKKLPRKARKNEKYFIPDPATTDKYAIEWGIADDVADVTYNRGLMCKTKEQAVKIAEAMIKVAREMQGFKGNKED